MKKCIALAAAALLAVPTSVAAQQIIAPTSAVINSGGPGFGSINDTFNQNGLSSNYVSGVTNFDTYIAADPRHTNIYPGFEWFTNVGTDQATVTYDFGSLFAIDAFALWNEEGAGIGQFNLLTSTDGIEFIGQLFGVVPNSNAGATNYGAQVFNFAPVDARYARLTMTTCPQAGGTFDGCGIGEVAFRTASTVTGAVPEPSTWAMMLIGFGAMGVALRRRERSTRATQLA